MLTQTLISLRRPVHVAACGPMCNICSSGLTLAEAAADLHGRIPLAILAGEELVVPLEGVALVAEVLDDRLLGQAEAGRGVAPVSPVLRLRGRHAHCGADREEEP